MQHIHDILRYRLLAQAGLIDTPAKKFITLEELEREVKETTWNKEFFKLQFNRLLMGRLRYGSKRNSTIRYNYTKSVAEKIKLYEETGNTELLVDISNYCLLEFTHGSHPNKHFSATDDAQHCEVIEP